MKKITSLSLGISFLIMSYTGIFLFLAPHGKVAYWSDWHLWGLTKNQYGDLHTTSMVSFLILGGLHIYYNWKPITSYIKFSSNNSSINKLGRKTLADLADMKKIDLQKAISILKQKGLNYVASDSRIKNIADELNMMPREVYELINK